MKSLILLFSLFDQASAAHRAVDWRAVARQGCQKLLGFGESLTNASPDARAEILALRAAQRDYFNALIRVATSELDALTDAELVTSLTAAHAGLRRGRYEDFWFPRRYGAAKPKHWVWAELWRIWSPRERTQRRAYYGATEYEKLQIIFMGGLDNTYYRDALTQVVLPDEFFWRAPSRAASDFEIAVTAVGAYEPAHYAAMSITTAAMLDVFRARRARLNAEVARLASREPIFGRRQLGTPRWKFGLKSLSAPIETLVEGLVSLNQLVNVLTISRVEGLTAMQLTERLLRADRCDAKLRSGASRITRAFQVGMVGPMVLRGEFHAEPLAPSANVKLGRAFKLLLRRAHAHILIARYRRGSATGKGVACPVTEPTPGQDADGIDQLARVYLRCYRLARKLVDQAPSR